VDGDSTPDAYSGGNGGEFGDADDSAWYQALSFVAWQAVPTRHAEPHDMAEALKVREWGWGGGSWGGE
jgi:hypothetical protein